MSVKEQTVSEREEQNRRALEWHWQATADGDVDIRESPRVQVELSPDLLQRAALDDRYWNYQ